MQIHLFEEWLRDWIETSTIVTVEPLIHIGLAEIPGLNPHMPYGIMTPVIMPRGQGTFQNPEVMRDYVWQMMWVGKTPNQVRWAGDIGRGVITGRDSNGLYLKSMAGPAGVGAVQAGSRQSDSLGGIVKSDDGKLFQIIDTYRLKVEE